MKGFRHPVRPHVTPNSRVTVGRIDPTVPSPQHPAWSAQQQGTISTVHWTPHGIFEPMLRAWQTRVAPQGMATRSVGANVQAPGFFQLIGIPDRFIYPNPRPRQFTGTAPTRSMAINPFPAFNPPVPSNPLPASWPGAF